MTLKSKHEFVHEITDYSLTNILKWVRRTCRLGSWQRPFVLSNEFFLSVLSKACLGVMKGCVLWERRLGEERESGLLGFVKVFALERATVAWRESSSPDERWDIQLGSEKGHASAF